jgi:hypothetical protein
MTLSGLGIGSPAGRIVRSCTFRYAYNLVHHGELVFNPGERVEGYTNRLWTVVLAWALTFDRRWAGLAPLVLALNASSPGR